MHNKYPSSIKKEQNSVTEKSLAPRTNPRSVLNGKIQRAFSSHNGIQAPL